MGWISNLREKLNPAQAEMVMSEGDVVQSTINPITYQTAYQQIEVVNRGINLTVDAAAEITMDLNASKVHGIATTDSNVRPAKLEKLLNFKPNPYTNADVFKRNIYIDILLEGNAFIYWDGAHLYNISANKMEILTDKINFIKGYRFGSVTYNANEIIHIRDNSSTSIYRGTSRLISANSSLRILQNMSTFQENFFKNGTVPGLVLKTPNVLSKKIKDRVRADWSRLYNPTSGGRRPIILDGEFDIQNLGTTNFQELDFQDSIDTQERKILKAIGVPPILLDAGNNANISPNQKLFYTNTVIPLVIKLTQALESFFGYDLKPVYQNILALRPDLRDESAYYTSLVNAGVITRNEARERLRLEASDQPFADELVLPANIAGSAVDPTQGGAPTHEPEN